MKRPFDDNFMEVMDRTALKLCKNIHTTVLAYVQSDEITLLLHNYKRINSEPWLGNVVQKIVSISAAKATLYFYPKVPESHVL
jgi:tRNA(His) 5'-end guanylyltransferase